MSRLFDRILAEKCYEPSAEDLFRKATVIVADQATEYFYALNDKEHWHLTDFSNIAPPFQNFFIETRHPSRIVSKIWGIREWYEPASDEMLRYEGLSESHVKHYRETVIADGGVDKRRPVAWGAHFRVIDPKILQQEVSKLSPISDLEMASLSLRWAVRATLYVEYKHSGQSGPYWEYFIGLAEDGSVVSTGPDTALGIDYPSPEHSLSIRKAELRAYDDRRSLVQVVRAEAFNHMNPLFLAITFMHCKNVELKAEAPPAKLAKRSRERGRPLCSYKVVDIIPLKRYLKSQGANEVSGIKMALHRCRGHFKTYTKEHPLLGRAVGTFFWEEHIRGNKSRGVIVHDYEVKNPDESI